MFKRLLAEIIRNHRGSGLFRLNLHGRDHLGEDVRGFGDTEMLDASAFEQKMCT